MNKYSFLNDYSEGGHPKVLELLQSTNLQQELGYGQDSFCIKAESLIKSELGREDVDVHFIAGGTQANLIVLASILMPYEGVIAAKSSHINRHETGAIEATGHKVITVNVPDGKLTPELVAQGLSEYEDEHTVMPRVVFISNSTELGTIYKEIELKALSEFCKSKGLYLYMDGARLASGLMSGESDLNMKQLVNYVDAFYIGGTKNGALIGEAIVLVNDALKKNFRFHIKQRGGLLAKGRVLGSQFLALFESDLYFELGKHANQMASKLVQGIEGLGYSFETHSTTNQIFPIFPNSLITRLSQLYSFYIWTKIDSENSSIRLVTSWATKEEKVQEFLNDLKNLKN